MGKNCGCCTGCKFCSDRKVNYIEVTVSQGSNIKTYRRNFNGATLNTIFGEDGEYTLEFGDNSRAYRYIKNSNTGQCELKLDYRRQLLVQITFPSKEIASGVVVNWSNTTLNDNIFNINFSDEQDANEIIFTYKNEQHTLSFEPPNNNCPTDTEIANYIKDQIFSFHDDFGLFATPPITVLVNRPKIEIETPLGMNYNHQINWYAKGLNYPTGSNIATDALGNRYRGVFAPWGYTKQINSSYFNQESAFISNVSSGKKFAFTDTLFEIDGGICKLRANCKTSCISLEWNFPKYVNTTTAGFEQFVTLNPGNGQTFPGFNVPIFTCGTFYNQNGIPIDGIKFCPVIYLYGPYEYSSETFTDSRLLYDNYPCCNLQLKTIEKELNAPLVVNTKSLYPNQYFKIDGTNTDGDYLSFYKNGVGDLSYYSYYDTPILYSPYIRSYYDRITDCNSSACILETLMPKYGLISGDPLYDFDNTASLKTLLDLSYEISENIKYSLNIVFTESSSCNSTKIFLKHGDELKDIKISRAKIKCGSLGNMELNLYNTSSDFVNNLTSVVTKDVYSDTSISGIANDYFQNVCSKNGIYSDFVEFGGRPLIFYRNYKITPYTLVKYFGNFGSPVCPNLQDYEDYNAPFNVYSKSYFNVYLRYKIAINDLGQYALTIHFFQFMNGAPLYIGGNSKILENTEDFHAWDLFGTNYCNGPFLYREYDFPTFTSLVTANSGIANATNHLLLDNGIRHYEKTFILTDFDSLYNPKTVPISYIDGPANVLHNNFSYQNSINVEFFRDA